MSFHILKCKHFSHSFSRSTCAPQHCSHLCTNSSNKKERRPCEICVNKYIFKYNQDETRKQITNLSIQRLIKTNTHKTYNNYNEETPCSQPTNGAPVLPSCMATNGNPNQKPTQTHLRSPEAKQLRNINNLNKFKIRRSYII